MKEFLELIGNQGQPVMIMLANVKGFVRMAEGYLVVLAHDGSQEHYPNTPYDAIADTLSKYNLAARPNYGRGPFTDFVAQRQKEFEAAQAASIKEADEANSVQAEINTLLDGQIVNIEPSPINALAADQPLIAQVNGVPIPGPAVPSSREVEELLK